MVRGDVVVVVVVVVIIVVVRDTLVLDRGPGSPQKEEIWRSKSL